MKWLSLYQDFKVVRTISRLVYFLMVLVFPMATGCVMVPIPTSPKTIAGTNIQEETISFIQLNMTTRKEIVDRFGEADWTFDDMGIIAYCWSTHDWNLWVAAGSQGDKIEMGKNYVLFFLFDSDLKVKSYTIIDRKLNTIREKARNWAEKQGVSLPLFEQGFIAPSITTGRSVICVYRHSGFSDAPFLLPLIQLDGKNVVELRKKQYTLLDVSAGPHEILVNPEPNPFSWVAPGQRPTQYITVNTFPGKISYIEVMIAHGWGTLAPILKVKSESDSIEKLRDFSHVP